MTSRRPSAWLRTLPVSPTCGGQGWTRWRSSFRDDGADEGATGSATLLGALVAAGIPVAEFREDEGGLEQLFLQLTAPSDGEPVEQAT